MRSDPWADMPDEMYGAYANEDFSDNGELIATSWTVWNTETDTPLHTFGRYQSAIDCAHWLNTSNENIDGANEQHTLNLFLQGHRK